MGRSISEKMNDGSSHCLDQDSSSLSLFRLPNELLEIILSYLSSNDIVQTFFDINSDRIQYLIQSYLIRFNLVSVFVNEEQWIKKYLIDQSRLSHCILSLRLIDRQMKLFSRYNIQCVQLESLHIINIRDNSLLLIDLLKIAPLLRSLSLDFSSDEMSHDSICCLARILFSGRTTWQQQLETLSINNIHIPFGFDSLQLIPNLRHMIINVRYENQLFDLCSYLPNLESFRVDVRRSSAVASSLNTLNVSPYLRNLTISGHFSCHSTLYKFILIYKSSLEHLKLSNIYHSDSVNGQELQFELVQHLSPIIQFRFHFQFPVNIEEFHKDSYTKTFDWTQVIVYPKVDDDSTVMVVSSLPTQRSPCYLVSH